MEEQVLATTGPFNNHQHMKIRIKGNSIRIRLSRSEVDRFAQHGHLEEHTQFVNGSFKYALQRSNEGDHLSAGLLHDCITMYVPDSMAVEWTTTDRVGFDNFMDTGNGNRLFLLLEKDFKCIDAPAHEDQSDNYEHPTQSCG